MAYQLLFLLGGSGLVVFSLIGLMAGLLLRHKGKKLKAQIHSEYSDIAGV